MLGMNSSIIRNVPPFAVIAGMRFLKFNAYGMKQRGFSPQDIAEVAQCYGFATAESVPAGALTREIEAFYARHKDEKLYRPTIAAA